MTGGHALDRQCEQLLLQNFPPCIERRKMRKICAQLSLNRLEADKFDSEEPASNEMAISLANAFVH